MCTNWPITRLFPARRNDLRSAVLIYIVREVERGCIYASILHSENVVLKSVTLSTLFLFASWNGLRVHKQDCFQIKLNWKTCFWTVPNVLQPLTALVTSSTPLHPPPWIVWTLDPQCQLFHSTDLLLLQGTTCRCGRPFRHSSQTHADLCLCWSGQQYGVCAASDSVGACQLTHLQHCRL